MKSDSASLDCIQASSHRGAFEGSVLQILVSRKVCFKHIVKTKILTS